MATTDGYAADPNEVTAILATDLDEVDRSDPTLLYMRATQLSARYAALLAEVGRLRAEAVVALYDGGRGGSYASVGNHLGLTRGRVQQFVERQSQRPDRTPGSQ